MKVNQEIQRLWSVLSHFIVTDKPEAHKHCNAALVATDPATDTLAPLKPGQQIGLYLGSELSPEVMHYAIATCIRLCPKLTVLTFQSESDAQGLLQPYQTELEDAHIALQLTVLSGEPPAALMHALHKRPEIALLICNKSGYLARSMKRGIVRQEVFPVPVVMVGASETTVARPAQVASIPVASRDA